MSVRNHLLWILPAAALSIGATPDPTPITWLEAPTYADAAAVYPARARAEHVGGAVELTCTTTLKGHLSACAELAESPMGYGFLGAAHKLVGRFRADAPHDTEVRVIIAFAPDMAGPAPGLAANPAWTAVPSASEFQASFPKTENGVNHVRVVLDCGVAAGGGLQGCAVASETPPGQGYGQGALALAPKFRVGLMTPGGVPTVGARVQVPIRYELTPDAPHS
ncbi:MAG: hypothetical protein E7812_02015 [Phenylobacterium sp.]|nr:MAG: hypothetical protein E7812_02015 [Phenylobacterium sp.]